MKILIVKDNYPFLQENGNWMDNYENEEVWISERDFDVKEVQKEWDNAKKYGLKLHTFLEDKDFELKLFEEMIK